MSVETLLPLACRPRRLAVAAAAGPAAWALNLQIGYALVRPACLGLGAVLPLAVNLLMLLVVVWAGWLARRCAIGETADTGGGAGGWHVESFVAQLVLALNALLALQIGLSMYSAAVLSPCE